MFPDLVDAVAFERQLVWLKRWSNPLPLTEALARLRDGSLPPLAISISFDDGYADNAEVALPILRRQELTAAFFVSTGFLGGGCMWNDRVIEAIRRAPPGAIDLTMFDLGTPLLDSVDSRRAVVDRVLELLKYSPLGDRLRRSRELAARFDCADPRLMMSEAQVRSLSDAGMDVGAHTVNHPILTRLAADEARREISESKGHLESILGAKVHLFAYPNGRPGRDYGREHVEMVRACGFAAALSTAWGVATVTADPLQIPRFPPWPRNPIRLGIELMRNLRRVRYEAA